MFTKLNRFKLQGSNSIDLFDITISQILSHSVVLSTGAYST